MDTKVKKICFFSGDITRSGGTERVSSIIANNLSEKEKFDVCFLSLFEEKINTFFPLNNGIKRNKLFEKRISGAKHFLEIIYRVRKFAKKNQIDILIDIDGILDMYSIPALLFTKTKIVSWEQFSYHISPFVPYRKYTRKLAAKGADAIVVLTESDKKNYQDNLNIKGIIETIYNPFSSVKGKNEYRIDSEEILTVGRLSYDKGLEYLVEVAKNVLRKNNNWKWRIIGEGEERKKIETKIKELGLENRLILEGKKDKLDEFYCNSAIYVVTSRYEGFGLTLLEAKSAYLPCVSFKCPEGPAEIIKDEVNGYLVDCFDTDQMAEKINELIDNNEKRKKFSDNALIGTEKFELEQVINKWEELLLRI